MKPKATIPPMPKMSEEQKKEQALRAIMQKKASLAEGILFNLCQNPALFNPDFDPIEYGIRAVKAANDMADEFMKVVYGQEITYKEKPAE